jgi:hypothetical protein
MARRGVRDQKQQKAQGSPKLKSLGSSRAFDSAAELLDVPRCALKLWLVDHRGFSPSEWSRWKTGETEIPNKTLGEFIMWRGGALDGDGEWLKDGQSLKDYLAWLERERLEREKVRRREAQRAEQPSKEAARGKPSETSRKGDPRMPRGATVVSIDQYRAKGDQAPGGKSVPPQPLRGA